MRAQSTIREDKEEQQLEIEGDIIEIKNVFGMEKENGYGKSGEQEHSESL